MSKKTARPLRTVLFCAGTEEAEIRETFASGADAIVIDLEEPCTPINEAVRDKGRALVKRLLAEFPKTGPMVFVRVQRPATGQTMKDLRAAGIRYPIGGMWTGKLNDEAGLRAWCTELRNIGYYGMMIGDPRLVKVVHEIFSPTKDELDYWQRLDRLQSEAEANGADKILDGDPNMGEAHVVHGAHVESARKNLVWARELGVI